MRVEHVGRVYTIGADVAIVKIDGGHSIVKLKCGGIVVTQDAGSATARAVSYVSAKKLLVDHALHSERLISQMFMGGALRAAVDVHEKR